MDHDLTIRAIADGLGDGALEGVFHAYWPAYQRWIRRAPDDPAACRGALRAHMPELEPTLDALLARFGGDEEVARFLTLWSPPPIVRGCTQVVLQADDGPRLMRTYDHHPRLFDGLVLQSRWLSRTTMVVADCLWGALDGMNDDGLAIALAFGGRQARGPGFGAPLVCRYVLETCATAAEARRALARLPVYMAYTFVVVDARGDFVTAYLGPDRAARFVDVRVSTNHQGQIEWERYAAFATSGTRLEHAAALVAREPSPEAARRAMLAPPLWRTAYATASGSLYLAEYAPRARTLALHWPARSERFEMDAFRGRTLHVRLGAPHES